MTRSTQRNKVIGAPPVTPVDVGPLYAPRHSPTVTTLFGFPFLAIDPIMQPTVPHLLPLPTFIALASRHFDTFLDTVRRGLVSRWKATLESSFFQCFISDDAVAIFRTKLSLSRFKARWIGIEGFLTYLTGRLDHTRNIPDSLASVNDWQQRNPEWL